MAKFTAGIGFGQASGSVAGTTYSRNRFGPYIRNRAMPVNPASSKQQLVRNRFGNLAESWRALTAAQRTEWNTQAPNITLTNSLGQQYNPTGFGFYVGINSARVAAGSAIVNVPPAQGSQAVITSASATAVGSTGVVTITFAPAIVATNFYILRATAPGSAGRSFFGRSQFKDLSYLTSADTSPAVATTAYNAIFGAVGTGDVGKKIAFQLVPVNAAGFQGTPTTFTAIVS